MKRALLIVGLGMLAIGQTPSPLHGDESRVTANKRIRNGDIMHLEGNVKIETEGMALSCDDADFNTESGEIVAQGNVKIKLPTAHR